MRFEDQRNAGGSPNINNFEENASEYMYPNPKISEDTQECCRTRFFHALGELSTFRSLQSGE